ncbi:Dirigent protein 3 [Nymphaea thermarum]|nr:Dirigent protein 3 [Nymphaea thermarum]
MAGSNHFFLCFLAILLTVGCEAKTGNPRIIPSPASRLQKQRTTHIHFFFHDIVTGRNPTVATIVQSPLNNSATGFGEVNMIDDPLTEGPELTSKLIGRAQGFYSSAALQNVGLLMVQTYVFLEGAYNGSTLSVLGRNSASVPIRELAVVGGTGYFRMAQGYTQARIHRLNATTDKMAAPFSKSATPIIVFCFFSLAFSTASARPVQRELAGRRRPLREKMSHLHFYFHDIVSGRNPTAVNIVRPGNYSSAPGFGNVAMIDDPLTEGPQLSSKLIGRAQGFYALDGQQETTLLMACTYVFLEGKYNGSTLSILGRNVPMQAVREMPVVGGSGLFRLARGYALARTYQYDTNTGDADVEYNVYVIHY